MFREQRRKFYRRNRFKPWYRKINHYLLNRNKIDNIIRSFRGDVSMLRRCCLRLDMVWALFRYGAYFREYFLFGFEGMPHRYRNSFITEGIRLNYYPRMNNPRNTDLLENKYRTYQKFKPMFQREMFRICKGNTVTCEEVAAFLDFAARHSEYMVKPTYAAFGRGVHKDKLENHSSAKSALEQYHQRDTVLEELISQDTRMAVLHPSSVNTLRIPTLIIRGDSGEKEVRLFHPSLRVGHGGSVIDNLSSGGISALIDPKNGVVYTDGADKKGRRYPIHPDTGIRFQGFVIPDWEKAVMMTKQAALMIPDNHFCGWDLALDARHGWCMVEANCTAQMGAMQIVTQTGRKAELESMIQRM